MTKVLEIFVVTLLIAVLHGFPQKPPERHPEHTNIQKQNNNLHNQRRPQISTFPASVNSRNENNNQHQNDHRKIRETTDEEAKPLDRSQISTLPAVIKTEEKTEKKSSEESDNRKTRKTDDDDSSEEDNKRKIKPVLYGTQNQSHNSHGKNHDSSEEDDSREK